MRCRPQRAKSQMRGVSWPSAVRAAGLRQRERSSKWNATESYTVDEFAEAERMSRSIGLQALVPRSGTTLLHGRRKSGASPTKLAVNGIGSSKPPTSPAGGAK